MAQYKTKFAMYAAWNYEREIEALNEESENGWQLVRAGNFHSRFRKNDSIRYRYQLDYAPRVEDMGRYIETYREQGWEYVNSTYNGWHYFRKLYDPSLPEEEYEIFTDGESLREMNGRWVKLAAAALALTAGLLAFWLLRLIRQPCWPNLLLTGEFAVALAMLTHGISVMRNPDAGRVRKGGWRLSVCLTLIAALCAGGVAALIMRPGWSQMHAKEWNSFASIEEDGCASWNDFTIRYPDNYFLTLSVQAEKPTLVRIVNGAGDVVYEKEAERIEEKNLRLPLAPGHYDVRLSSAGGSLDIRMDVD